MLILGTEDIGEYYEGEIRGIPAYQDKRKCVTNQKN